MALSSSFSSSSSCIADHRWIYDVFVSFRGKDIRKSFMDHLFTDFKRKGIFPFRDDKQLKIGEEISPGLDNAIRKSRILVVMFSKNYASSTWCLDELVQIFECKETEKDKYEVRAIFYDVDPTVVRNHTDSYEVALNKHEAKGKKGVPEWKEALAKAADLPAWDLQDMADGFESKFVDIISKEIFQILSHGPLDVGENLVGLHSRVEQMDLLRFVKPLDQNKAHMIGICGISGVGKTTIARAIYNLLHIHFEGCSFCEDVKGVEKMHGLPHVQKQLLDDITKAGDLKIHSVGRGITVIKQRMSSKRVLIILDDVNHRGQFKALAGTPDWFGPGSLIIVTGKDRQLLTAHGVEEIFEVDLLDQDESTELFSLYAFKQKNPKQEFKELSKRVVHYVNGHPLALKVLGCFLFRKNVKEWESELDKLKSYPNFEIHKVLKLSYDGLDSNQQEIFLDIACFFRWEKPDFVKKILDACNLFSDTDIRVLVDKSFIKISSGALQLHDLLKKMGQQVVREESENPGKWSRLWSQKDSRHVLNNDKGTEAVKGLNLKLTNSAKVHIGSKSFARMSKLRVLKLFYTPLKSPENGSYHRNVIWEDTQVDHSKSLDFLSNELRWLYWHGYPFEFLPSTFYPENLVALNMSYSNMKQLWTGSKDFKKLTLMELRHCDQLTKTPDFTEIPNLEELFLEGCTNLVELHPSVGILKKLIVLNLKNCKNLKSFPSTIELESLRILILSGCSKVDNLSEDLGNMRALMELHADGTAIKQFPSSIRSLHSLEALTLGGRKGVPYKSWSSISWPSFLPRKSQNSSALTLPSLSGLRLIRNLDVSHRNLSGTSLNDISSLSLLEKLNLSGNDFVSIPTSFAQLSGLKMLGLVGCKNLQTLPELPSTIDIIDAQDCTSLRELPSTMYNSRSLRFDFSNCSKLAENQTIESLASMLVPQRRIDPYRALNMFLPGSRVPKWFTNRNVGDSIRLDLPQPWSYRKFKGFAACAVFAPKNPNGSKGRLIEVGYSVSSFNNAFLCGSSIETRIFPNEIRRFESDQVWLSYMIPRLRWEMRWEKAKDYIDVSFDIHGICCEVKECGVRLIYEEDEEFESSSRMIEWLPHDSAETVNEPPSA